MSLAIALLLMLMTGVSLAQVPEGWFPFVIGEIAPDSVANVSGYNNAVAGAKGFIQARDGRFVDGQGNRIRFLATNLTFDSAFPDKDQAPLIARRMAALGINCVRFHHMDNQNKPRGIWDPAFKDRQHMDPEQLDRLDWIIYQLKLNGIYSNINLHVSRKFGPADGFENAEALPNYDKGVDNWQPRMIELQKVYARELLTHLNPYTNTRYVEEPCIAMVELNNENSALQFAMGQEFHNLPEPYKGQLQMMWVDYLKGEYGTTEALRAAWDEGSAPLGEELVRNRDFGEGTKEWVLETRNRQTDVFEIVDDPEVGKAIHARLNSLGVNPWDFQVHQTGHDLKDGQVYTLSFKIKADPPRTVSVGVRRDMADWRDHGLSASVQAGNDWTEHSFTFSARDTLPNHSRFSFNCQNALGSVWLADISLRTGGIRGLGEDQSLEAGNVAFSSRSSTARAWEDWLAFFVNLEQDYTQPFHRMLKDELGLRALVVDTQASYGGIGGVWRESRLDYVDMHSYWQHPSFPGRPWDPGNWTIGNTSMAAAAGRDTLTNLARHRVAGLPFTVSEYNHPAPGDYRAECMPMLAAFAGLQDWDGIFEFDYGKTPTQWEDAKINGYFQMVTDPAKLAWFPIAANLFRRGDVSPAREEVRLRVPENQIVTLLAKHGNSAGSVWDAAGVPRIASIRHRLAVEFVPNGEVSAPRVSLPQDGASLRSDTGEITWASEPRQDLPFRVETERTCAVMGTVAKNALDLRPGVEITLGDTSNGWAAVGLTSMDGKPLAESGRMLLVLMNRVENQGMVWDEARRTVGRNWGKGPTVAEPVPATLRFADSGLVAYALDGSGTRGRRVEATNGALILGADCQTVWYELVRE